MCTRQHNNHGGVGAPGPVYHLQHNQAVAP